MTKVDERVLSQTINRLSGSIQPLVFETGFPEAPYSLKGTVFLVGYRGRAFALTARHALSDKNVSPLCIFVSDTSQKILPLKNVFLVPTDAASDDFADLAVIEIDLSAITVPELGCARVIDLALSCGEWLSGTETADMFLIGYPEEYSYVEYDQEALLTQRYVLHGRYAGPSEIPFLHVLEASGRDELNTFSGFSGGPVFASIVDPGGRARITLCGMALRGTPVSRRIHFLDISVLLDALHIAFGGGRRGGRHDGYL